jgi:hypothetical protein
MFQIRGKYDDSTRLGYFLVNSRMSNRYKFVIKLPKLIWRRCTTSQYIRSNNGND